jgi:hypothetical protein
MAKGRAREIEQLLLPKFDYYLEKSDPDIMILRRQDGAFVAAFSALGAKREGIVEAAKGLCTRFVSCEVSYSPVTLYLASELTALREAP